VIVLALLGVIPPIGRVRLAIVLAMLFAFDASLGVNGLLYPWLYAWLPPMRSMRVPARFSILFGMSLAVLAGYGVRYLTSGRPRRWQGVTIAMAVAGIAADVWPVLKLTDVWTSPPPIYDTLRGRRDVLLAEFPAGGPVGRFPATPYLYFAVWHWLPMINGYSGYHPRSYTDLLGPLERFPEAATIELLQSRGVTHVTVNCALFTDAGYGERCGRVLQAAAREPTLREAARARWDGEPVVLFELARPTRAQTIQP
jgi:hypothetical protein